MTMKKRFLGLALAAMVAVPATTAYADTITMKENDIKNHSVTVSGTVKNSEGVAPEGVIEVELPTAMQFQVDQKGNFIGSEFTVTNKSQSNIDVSVADFSESNEAGGIKLVQMGEDSEFTSKTRDNVALQLSGNLQQTVDLAEFKKSKTPTKILTVNGNTEGGYGVGTIRLNGKAGKSIPETPETRAIQGPEETVVPEVEKNGIQEDFTLVFQIKKSGGK